MYGGGRTQRDGGVGKGSTRALHTYRSLGAVEEEGKEEQQEERKCCVTLPLMCLSNTGQSRFSCSESPPPAAHLSKEGHSEVGAQQPLARVHHLHDFGVGAVQRVVQVRQFLLSKSTKAHKNEIYMI